MYTKCLLWLFVVASSAIAGEVVGNTAPCRVAALAGWPERTPREVVEYARGANDGYIYLMRGVAPREAAFSARGRRDGRIAGRTAYGILDPTVIPGYVINDRVAGFAPEPPASYAEMFRGMKYYANTGAAAERATREGKTVGPPRALELYPGERGRILLFRVPRNFKLKKHPETFAAIPERVVAIPPEAELVAILPSPRGAASDTGLPVYAQDERAEVHPERLAGARP